LTALRAHPRDAAASQDREIPPFPEKLTSFFRRLRKKVRRARRPRQDYVGVIVSYPKAGRTWLRVMLDELGLPVECTHDGSGTARPFERLALCRSPTYRERPVLFMLRDPRDTVVSYYFQRTLRSDRFEGAMAEFVRDPAHGIDKIIRFNLAWLQLGRDLPAFLPITYEALKSTPADVMRSVVDFVGAKRVDSEIESVCLNNTFEKMKSREGSGEYNERYRKMLRPASEHPESYKVRRGKIGGYADYLTEEDIAYSDDALRRYDYFQRVSQLMPSRAPALQAQVGE
jgi:hypothetical protein